MYRTVLNAKIHRARVTAADLHYVGSISIDSALMEAAGILPFERVQVADIDNGARLETYAIGAPAGSGEIQINGAAAHLVDVGDLVIIMSYVSVEDEEAHGWQPTVIHVDADNRVV
jgi:aspartate 1-decarboxylase